MVLTTEVLSAKSWVVLGLAIHRLLSAENVLCCSTSNGDTKRRTVLTCDEQEEARNQARHVWFISRIPTRCRSARFGFSSITGRHPGRNDERATDMVLTAFARSEVDRITRVNLGMPSKRKTKLGLHDDRPYHEPLSHAVQIILESSRVHDLTGRIVDKRN